MKALIADKDQNPRALTNGMATRAGIGMINGQTAHGQNQQPLYPDMVVPGVHQVDQVGVIRVIKDGAIRVIKAKVATRATKCNALLLGYVEIQNETTVVPTPHSCSSPWNPYPMHVMQRCYTYA